MPKPPYPKTGEWTKVGDRLWARQRGGAVRYYGDFRDFRAEGGKQERLVVPGEKMATANRKLAEQVLRKRLHDLEVIRAMNQGRVVKGLPSVTPLAAFVKEHLAAKKQAGRCTDSWLEGEELRLERAVAHLGPNTDLSAIEVTDVQAWDVKLAKQGLSGGTRRQHLNSLSNLYRRAQSMKRVQPGFNPVAAMLDKPSARRQEARWLQVHEAALLLEAARTYRPRRGDERWAFPFAYELIATALLTGGRPSEVLGLEVDDISFDRKTVTFRPNKWRRLKTATSFRTVPLWPQLEAILRPYIVPTDRTPRSGLLFPSMRSGTASMVDDPRKLLDAVARRVGYKKRELNMKDFRHTYCAARLQTLDNGEAVAEFTVGKELGHGGVALVHRIYGHLGTIRHRSEVVEYKVSQHRKVVHRERPISDWVAELRV